MNAALKQRYSLVNQVIWQIKCFHNLDAKLFCEPNGVTASKPAW